MKKKQIKERKGRVEIAPNGNPLYLVTLFYKDGLQEVFTNVASNHGTRHLDQSEAFFGYSSTKELIPLSDYQDIVNTEYSGNYPFSRVDFRKLTGLSQRRINQLTFTGSLHIEKDGCIYRGNMEVVANMYKKVIKPANVRKAKSGAAARWGIKTDVSSGGGF